MGYQNNQYGAMSTPNIPSSTVGLASGTPIQQNAPQTMNQGSLSSIPEEISANINAYNPYSNMMSEGDYNEGVGIANYNSAKSLYGADNKNWIPWQMQANSAGGYGADARTAGNMFLPGGGQLTQAGSRYSYGSDPSKIKSESINRNPYTGEIMGYGSFTNVDNKFGQSYLNNLDRSNSLQKTKGSDLWSPYEQNLWATTHPGQQSGVDALKASDDEYYGNIDKTFGVGQFDQKNFNNAGKPGGYANYLSHIVNPYQYASAPAPAQRGNDRIEQLAPPVNRGFQARPDIRNQMGYDPRYAPRSPFTG